MTATTAPEQANLLAAPARTNRSPCADPRAKDIEAGLERMSVRINAVAAHRNSLNRAAQGVRAISGQLAVLLDHRVADRGHTPATYLTGAAIEAMQAEVDAVLAGDGDISVETQRTRLRSALWHGRNALFLLSR
jgi:hypothetical protein